MAGCSLAFPGSGRPCNGFGGLRRNTGRRCPAAAQALGPKGPQFPPYDVVHKGDEYLLRMYSPYTVVQTAYTRRDEGYLALGSYFSGDNEGGVQFRETQPVIMLHSGQEPKVMQLMVGDPKFGRSPPKTPLPKNSDLSLDVSGGELLAIIPVEGNITAPVAAYARKKLMDLLEKDGIKISEDAAAGSFRVAQYGPLFALERMNEIMIQVKL